MYVNIVLNYTTDFDKAFTINNGSPSLIYGESSMD